MRKIVLATSNQGKLREMQCMLKDYDFDLMAQSNCGVHDAKETGLTYIENALIKARHACKATGLPALSDDSGLCVDALNGAPGIYSARYSGSGKTEANWKKLLSAMHDIPTSQRQAHFYCCLVLMQHAHDPAPIMCTGQWKGRLLTQPQGELGFGYDSLFWVEEYQCSAAELETSIKNRVSHRALALKQLIALLQS